MFGLPLSERTPNLEALRTARMPGAEKIIPRGRDADLQHHLGRLTREFAGDPQIDFYHATLNVLIRRNLEKPLAVQRFDELWREQAPHLLNSLSARWLISACDTIIDVSPDPAERAIACVGSTLMNTIKLYETERRGVGVVQKPLSAMTDPVPLFDGLTSFVVGGGDMIHNLWARTRAVCSRDTAASKIVLELLARAARADTIYSRLAALHEIEETRW
ncbi:MAG TPA: hypothetical protein VEA80_09660 [Vitreimonas sp.]|uniref:hypothetical protein n=1 Tax=Vitreimonas sp. TaxID=3069702 RepID=UPI002D46A20B|nr:hypothetical protein [Vitreimonas sp.]HYD87730.1 hypothetical protein [Vitreimonas sp.]